MNPLPPLPPLPPRLRIYLAGPMQGIPEFNFPRFNAVATALELDGHEVFNPAKRDVERHDGVDLSIGNLTGDITQAKQDHGFSLRDALADDTQYICRRATLVALLPGWEKSNGAQAEHRLAVALKSEGVDILYMREAEVALIEAWTRKRRAA